MAYLQSADLRRVSNMGILELHLVQFDYLVSLGCPRHRLDLAKIPILRGSR